MSLKKLPRLTRIYGFKIETLQLLKKILLQLFGSTEYRNKITDDTEKKKKKSSTSSPAKT